MLEPSHIPQKTGSADRDAPMDVTIIDCGIGNIKSVQRMFEAVDVQAEIISEPGMIAESRRIVLPGVGAFDAGMNALTAGGWINALNDAALERKIPVLGICLGMQLFCRGSAEGAKAGLGWIDADVVKIDIGENKALKLPHMGWAPTREARVNPLINSAEGEQRFYYVHKYRAVCDREENVLATAHYGTDFTSAIQRDNIYGVQFHPEKSHRFGMRLMRSFFELPC